MRGPHQVWVNLTDDISKFRMYQFLVYIHPHRFYDFTVSKKYDTLEGLKATVDEVSPYGDVTISFNHMMFTKGSTVAGTTAASAALHFLYLPSGHVSYTDNQTTLDLQDEVFNFALSAQAIVSLDDVAPVGLCLSVPHNNQLNLHQRLIFLKIKELDKVSLFICLCHCHR